MKFSVCVGIPMTNQGSCLEMNVKDNCIMWVNLFKYQSDWLVLLYPS